jgi:hypothetical protein
MLYRGKKFSTHDFRKEVGIKLGEIWKMIFQPNRMGRGFGMRLRPEHSTEFPPKSQAEGKNQHSGWGGRRVNYFLSFSRAAARSSRGGLLLISWTSI